MLVMLAYDLPEGKQQTKIRKEFESLGGIRVQYSIYIFEGEDHEVDRVIRYMQRVAIEFPKGDIRLIPMEKAVWEQQHVLLGEKILPEKRIFPSFILFW